MLKLSIHGGKGKFFFCQAESIAVHRDNVASVLETLPQMQQLHEEFYLYDVWLISNNLKSKRFVIKICLILEEVNIRIQYSNARLYDATTLVS